MQRSELTGTVEGQHVVASLDSRARTHEMHFLGGAVETGMHDDSCAPAPGRGTGMEIPGQRVPPVWDLDRLDRRLKQAARRLVTFHRTTVGPGDARILRLPVEEEF